MAGGRIHGSDFRGYGNLPRQKRRFRLSARRYPRCGLWLRASAGRFRPFFRIHETHHCSIGGRRRVRRDPLTQLPNRFAFNESLEAALNRLARSGEECAVFLLDLDSF
ncbi:diguanylate cyclase domain-containing protein [Bradyrhizobium sp. BR 1432]|uniref:diguanylate cyclase domain-containing protein n=1 Tax=Bradyrhizobium sp. BR 1432 TaxID=3447966 RepID=UPI003EE7436D